MLRNIMNTEEEQNTIQKKKQMAFRAKVEEKDEIL